MNIRHSIVVVLNRSDKIVGTGFLVGEDLIVTCAHVIASAKAVEGDIVQVRFDGQSQKINALVEPQYWSDTKDVAVLRLETTPHGAKPLPLAPAAGSAGHDFYSFGYASVIDVQGIGARGTIVEVVEGGNLVQLTSQEPDRGMSGGPVFDEARQVVVGMIAKGKREPGEDQSYRNLNTTFAISTEVIFSVCDEVGPTEICPYRSLTSFSEEDAPFFFGRKKLTEKLVHSLKREPRFLAVLGPSGSGKSSVVKAGLIPALKAGKVPGSQSWGVLVARPADRLYEQLVDAGLLNAQTGLEQAARSWLESNPDKTRLVLVIDQFEEMLVSPPKNVRQKFLKELEQLLNASVNITIVLALRDDFYSRFLNEAANLSGWLEHGLINIPPVLESEDLHEMVSAPAQAVGLTFETGLVELIISDAKAADRSTGQARSTILPLLEFALTRLWEQREDGRLTHSAYQDVGGTTGSLSQWADQTYYALGANDRSLAETIFCTLVHLGNEKEQIPDTRRVIPISELVHSAKKVTTEAVINRLIQARLLSVQRDFKTGEQFVEIIHDALLREWRTLELWIDNYRTKEARARERRRLAIISGLSLGLVVMIALALIAWGQRNEAVSQRQTAVANEAEAIRQTDISKSLAYSAYAQNALSKNDQELALAFAVEAVKIKNPPAQANTILGQVAFAPGTRRVITGIPSGSAFRIAMSSDGNLLASASGAGDIQLWDALTGKELRRFGNHGTYGDGIDPLVPGLTFTSDERMVISAGGEDIRFWDVQSGELLRKIYIGEGLGFISATFSQDAKSLLWGSSDGSLHLWELEAGKEVMVFSGKHQGAVQGVALNTDNTLALSGGEDGRVVLWNVASGKQIREFAIESPSFKGEETYSIFRAVAFSPDQRLILGGTYGGAVEIWNIETGELVRHVNTLNLTSGIKFSPDGKYIILGTQHSIEIWDIERGQQAFSLSGHTNWIEDVSFSPDGKRVVSASDDGTVRIWDIVSETTLEFRGHTSAVTSLTVSGDGNYLLSSSWDGSLRVWDVASGREVKRIKATDDEHFASASLSANGNLIAAGNAEGIRLYNFETGEFIRAIRGPEIGISKGVIFSPKGNTLFATDIYAVLGKSYESSIYALNTNTAEEEYRFFNRGLSESIMTMDVSDDGSYIVSANYHPSEIATAHEVVTRLNVWDTVNQKKVRELLVSMEHGGVLSLAFNADNKLVYAGTMSGKILVYEVETGQLIRTVSAHSLQVLALETSSDGNILASSSDEKTVRLWDTKTWSEIGVYEVELPVRSLAFAPNSSRLFGGTDTGRIFSWLVAPGIEDTLAWIRQNRYVRPFSCSEREQYLLPIQCGAQENLPHNAETQVSANKIESQAPIPTKESLEQAPLSGSSNDVFTASAQNRGEYTGECQIWAFEVKAGDTVNLFLESSQFDPYLILKNTDGGIIAVNDDIEPGWSNNAALKKIIIQKTGTYYAIVDRFLSGDLNGGDGVYRITISVSNPTTTPEVNLVPAPVGKFGFGWELDDNQIPRILGAIDDSPAFMAGLYPGDVILKINDIDTREMSKRQIWDVLRGAEGNHVTFVVQHLGAKTEEIQVVSGPPAQGSYLAVNTIQPGVKEISAIAPSDKDFWVFEGQENQRVAILMGGTMDNALASMKILAPDQSVITDVDNLGNHIENLVFNWNAFVPMLELPANGYYGVSATSQNMTPGQAAYTLSVQNLVDQGELNGSAKLSGALSATEGYYWTFQGQKGQFLRLNLDLQDSQVEPFFILLGPDGSIMGASGLDGFDKFTDEYNMERLPDASNDGAFPIMSDGTYTIILLPYLREYPVKVVGTYTLSFEIGEPKIERQLQPGQSVTTNLTASEAKLFQFTGKSGEKIRVTVNAENPASNANSYFEAANLGLLDTIVYVVSEEMVPIIANRDYGDTTNSQVEFSLPTDGSYYIVVGTEAGFGEGQVTIIVESVQ